ncbi:L-arabinonolactonase [Variovorax sp. TBS-050B]|uniref:SMP-30/gluconolactonase/LRE family protein n=1 Tax=Variovorax sp. TBS-050B TaxID=2940551 RepID=UPI00247307BE|nr:SMP-30/gluconolactonase/LRE family protein [Variovorax sp. TBS-050B]MDH6590232.1 L-arabinonolactonase [Variovorax sp. TBS-050B]
MNDKAAIRILGETRDLLGESPCWDARGGGTLCWIDALAGTLHRLRPDDGAAERHRLPAPVGSIARCESGAVLVALRHGFARYDFETRRLETIASIDTAHPEVRLNDGKCDPWGNFIAGTLHGHRQDGEPVLGALYRLRPGGRVERLADGFALANGPCFSLDGRTLYVADSPLRTIWAYDYDPEGPLANRRVFARTEHFASGPDGATVDAEGFVWSVLPRAAKMARFAPDGSVERSIDLPATYPTSLCFGGPELDRVYLTSISKSTNLTGSAPQDGALFELRGLPAPGLPAHRFAD